MQDKSEHDNTPERNMAKADPTSEEYQAKTDVIALVGLSLLMLAWVVGPLFCIIWNAF